MLFLVGQERTQGKVWWLRPDAAMTVGRKGAPFLIDGDHSVSRSHATLYIGGAHTSAEVTVRDDMSKFGVHINGRPCVPNTQSPLRVGDSVTFGAQGSTFELRSCRTAFCLANMRSSSGITANRLAARAGETGIGVVDSVDKCTHLITPTLAVTSKLVGALVFGCHITSPAFLDLICSLPPALNVPDPKPEAVDAFINNLEFLPHAPLPTLPPDIPIDLSAVDWSPNPARKRLFVGKLCLFSSQAQHEKYKSMIQASGGSSAMLSCVPRPTSAANSVATYPKDLIDKAISEIRAVSSAAPGEPEALICLILPQTSYKEEDDSCYGLGTTNFVKEVARTLGVRPISESEIGLAVLFVANETHTNPKYIEESNAQSSSNSANSAIKPDQQATAPIKEAVTNTERPPRQRKGLRYSNFWSAKVAGDDASPPENATTNAGDARPLNATTVHTASPESTPGIDSATGQSSLQDPKESQPLRRRRGGIDAFWSASVEGNEASQHSIDSSPPRNGQENCTGGSTSLMNDSGVHSLNEVESPLPLVTEPAVNSPLRTVSLVRLKQRSDPLEAGTDSNTAPNFKRFRKTLHLYQ